MYYSSKIGALFPYGMSYFLDIENIYLNVTFIALVMGVLVFVLNIYFNREFVDNWFKLIVKRKKNL